MVSQQEKARLIEAYKNEPVYAAAVTAKCSACLLILAGLALIGGGMDSTGDDAARLQRAPVVQNAPVTAGTMPRADLDPGTEGRPDSSSVNAAESTTRTRNVAFDASCGSGCSSIAK
jgi:hypothetical protein